MVTINQIKFKTKENADLRTEENAQIATDQSSSGWKETE